MTQLGDGDSHERNNQPGSLGADNERRNREAKLKLYSLHGVQGYLIVDWRIQ